MDHFPLDRSIYDVMIATQNNDSTIGRWKTEAKQDNLFLARNCRGYKLSPPAGNQERMIKLILSCWKPKMHDDVMLNGVFRICLWLVARQLRIPNDRKIYDQTEIAV